MGGILKSSRYMPVAGTDARRRLHELQQEHRLAQRRLRIRVRAEATTFGGPILLHVCPTRTGGLLHVL